MQIRNSQTKLGFGNLNITKFEKVGNETIKISLGTLRTTKKFDKTILDICGSTGNSGTFPLSANLSEKIADLVDSKIHLPFWKAQPKSACYTGDKAEIIDKFAHQNGGYLISVGD